MSTVLNGNEVSMSKRCEGPLVTFSPKLGTTRYFRGLYKPFNHKEQT